MAYLIINRNFRGGIIALKRSDPTPIADVRAAFDDIAVHALGDVPTAEGQLVFTVEHASGVGFPGYAPLVIAPERTLAMLILLGIDESTAQALLSDAYARSLIALRHGQRAVPDRYVSAA